jgi:peptidoglycan/xylan/chitin deacetylase (PgdA/CDA1 family)
MSSGPLLTRRAVLGGSLGLAAMLATGCNTGRSSPSVVARPSIASVRARPSIAPVNPSPQPSRTDTARPTTPGALTDTASVAARATVPVLCWHQLREWRPSDSAYSRRLFVCPPRAFRAQLDALAEDGWNVISPDRYLAHLTTGAALPAKPVMLSFDDSQGSQITEGLPQLRRRNMTATFFCMTIVLDKPHWMSRDDLRRLVDADMTVAAHTYDHKRADRYSGRDWKLEFDAPREVLEKVIRRPVEHFAYPYGAWAPIDFTHLQAAGYRTAFQLSDKPLDRKAPLFTLRRILVDSTWNGDHLLRQIRNRA